MERLNTQLLNDGTVIDRYLNRESNEIVLFVRPPAPIESVTVKVSVSRLQPEETDV